MPRQQGQQDFPHLLRTWTGCDTGTKNKLRETNPMATQKKKLKPETEEVIKELIGEEALPIAEYLKGKEHVSEFKVAQDCRVEIHKTRNLLYRLLEHNLVFFHRKKDKIKGWYICYWDFN